MKAIPEDAYSCLKSQLSSQRQSKMEQVSKQRTRHLQLILQDVHSDHNISACLRSAEALGVDQVHIVHEDGKFRASTVAKGVGKWLTLHTHSSIEECGAWFAKRGIPIFGALATQESQPLQQLEVTKPFAILFGNEKSGISKTWYPFLAGSFTIPMIGFVESFNISVSAAITMHYLLEKMKDQGIELPIKPEEQRELLNRWSWEHFPNPQNLYKRLSSSFSSNEQ